MTESGSGPLRLEAKGMLKERLTRWPGTCGFGCIWCCVAMFRLMLVGGMDMSWWWGRPKPIAGVILSQPWRAWPVKLEILCIGGVDG